MIQTVLFDLDNTLVLFNEEVFFKHYIGRLIPHFQDVLPADLLQKKLIESTQVMIKNDGSETNLHCFLNHFTRDLGKPKDFFWQLFIEFYENYFDSLGKIAHSVPQVKEVVDQLKQQDMRLVLASNPVWPLLVQKMRVKWAGLVPEQFDYITHIENTSYCKPKAEYYMEICDALKIRPDNCIMVGNDGVNDMAAGSIGMRTYLTTDWLTEIDNSLALSDTIRKHVGNEEKLTPDYQGPLHQLPNQLFA